MQPELALPISTHDAWTASERSVIQIALAKIQAQRSDELLLQASEISTLLEKLGVDHETLCAAVLYVAFKTAPMAHEMIGAEFGPRIENLYRETHSLLEKEGEWLTQQDSLPEKARQKGDTLHMMLLSMMGDLRVVLILLAHQVVVMRHLKDETSARQKLVAQETLTVFAPLANRLGIGQIKWELEDLSFRALDTEHYKEIAKALEERRVSREQFINDVVLQLNAALMEGGISAEVTGRPKHIYSIWRKMQNKRLAFNELYDVRAVRILVSDVTACYAALSVAHSLWPFIPGEYDDYIAAPKANNYRSLHTAVVGPDNRTIEIQIRTPEMHDFAELGVAAHWRYKEGGKRDEALDRRIESLRSALSQNALEGVEQKSASVGQAGGNIYVLTPKGNVVELPVGATPLDFAYHVHTELGHRCRGAKVNGHIVPLTSRLASGQQVEVITVKSGAPSRDWLIAELGYLHTARARAKVKSWFKSQYRDEYISAGRVALARELGRYDATDANFDVIAKQYGLPSIDDLFAAVGRGELGAVQIAQAVQDMLHPPPVVEPVNEFKAPSKVTGRGSVTVGGVDDLLTSIARCCKPMPGDDVVGYITRGRGVTIHRRNCINIQRGSEQDRARQIEVNWGTRHESLYEVDIEILALDRTGLLRDISSVLSGENVNVLGANTHSDKRTQEARMRLTLEIGSSERLSKALSKVLQVRGVMQARRLT